VHNVSVVWIAATKDGIACPRDVGLAGFMAAVTAVPVAVFGVVVRLVVALPVANVARVGHRKLLCRGCKHNKS